MKLDLSSTKSRRPLSSASPPPCHLTHIFAGRACLCFESALSSFQKAGPVRNRAGQAESRLDCRGPQPLAGKQVSRFPLRDSGLGPRCFSTLSRPRASPTGSRSSFWWARCSAAWHRSGAPWPGDYSFSSGPTSPAWYPATSSIRGAPRALDAVHAEWRRRNGVGVGMASDVGHAGCPPAENRRRKRPWRWRALRPASRPHPAQAPAADRRALSRGRRRQSSA